MAAEPREKGCGWCSTVRSSVFNETRPADKKDMQLSTFSEIVYHTGQGASAMSTVSVRQFDE
jgi:hypothetical protein